MDVTNVGGAQTVLRSIEGGDDKRAQLQMTLLKRTLDMQKDQAAELVRMMEGKGQVIDMRV